MFILHDIVTIKTPLFEGSSGVITGGCEDGGVFLYKVDFTDRFDHVNKQIYVAAAELELKKMGSH